MISIFAAAAHRREAALARAFGETCGCGKEKPKLASLLLSVRQLLEQLVLEEDQRVTLATEGPRQVVPVSIKLEKHTLDVNLVTIRLAIEDPQCTTVVFSKPDDA